MQACINVAMGLMARFVRRRAKRALALLDCVPYDSNDGIVARNNPGRDCSSSMRRKCCKGGDGMWFKWHRGLQMLGLILATVGSIIAIAN